MKIDAMLPVFPSRSLQIVCISDTHNEDPSDAIPDADILIHAGDLTDHGTLPELQAAFEWIKAQPHTVKIVVAGNHDLGLDPHHKHFDKSTVELFTSPAAVSAGIHYLDRETRTVANYISASGETLPLRVYGNPLQEESPDPSYAFTYKGYPSAESTEAWETAPGPNDGVNIWVMHSPPRERLDIMPFPEARGCIAQAKCIAASRPTLCVFGHFHYSWGVETVQWDGEKVAKADILTLSHERKRGEGLQGPETMSEFEFSGPREMVAGQETLFVNAGWMTMKMATVDERNPPLMLTVDMP